MPYITSIERKGIEKGREEGIREGIREGMREGMRKGILEGIALALDSKFGQPGRKLLPKIRALTDIAALRAIGRTIKKAKTLEDVRRHLR